MSPGGLYDQIKNVTREKKDQIELLSRSLTSALAGLVYSEFVSCFRRVSLPTPRVLVPQIKTVVDLFEAEGPLVKFLTEKFITDLTSLPLWRACLTKPEIRRDLDIFEEEDIVRIILELSILPQLSKTIPGIIGAKFNQLNTPNLVYQQNPEICLFQRLRLSQPYLDYITQQTLIHMLMILPGIVRDSVDLGNGDNTIYLHADNSNFLAITNIELGIIPIYFNHELVKEVNLATDLVAYVTSTQFSKISMEKVTFSTSPFNHAAKINLLGIFPQEES